MTFDPLCFIYLFIFLISCLSLFVLIVYFTTTRYPVIRRSRKEDCFYDVSGDRFIPFPSIKESPTLNLSVIIPAYNEEERLPPMLNECLEFLEKRTTNKSFKYEIIIVSDGSKDKTVEIGLTYVKAYGTEKIRVLNLEQNRGKGGAVRLGVLSSRGSVILFADADGATTFADLLKLEDNLKSMIRCDYIKDLEIASERDAVVCGSRSHLEKESLATRSYFRTFLMHGFHFLVWSLAVRTVRDTQCGFKLLTRSSARELFMRLHVEKWAFDVELIYLAEVLGIPTTEVAVNWTEIDGSKIVPVLSWLQMGRDLFLIWLRYKTGAWRIYHTN